MNYLKSIAVLVKYKVSLSVTFTAVVGSIFYTGSFDRQILILGLGVFILAGGSSALNEFHESKYDAQMARTKHRPIPSGDLSARNALLISILFILTGLFLLYSFFGMVTASLGLFNILWYNLFYTNLKRYTPFAVVPGSLTGAIPVLMGWTAVGGNVFDTAILFVAFFLFIWQIPHFWLLMLKYGKEYEEAGFPTINQAVSPANLKVIIFSWVIATSIASIMVPLVMVNSSGMFFLGIFVLNLLFIGIYAKLSFGIVAELNFKRSFMSINIYMFFFMIMLIVYRLSTS